MERVPLEIFMRIMQFLTDPQDVISFSQTSHLYSSHLSSANHTFWRSYLRGNNTARVNLYSTFDISTWPRTDRAIDNFYTSIIVPMSQLSQRSKMRMMLKEGCLEGGHTADGDGKARCSGYVVKTFGKKMCFPCLEAASHTTWTLLSLRNVLRYGLGIDPFGGSATCSGFATGTDTDTDIRQDIRRDVDESTTGGEKGGGGGGGGGGGNGGILHTANRTLHGDPEDWILDEELADFVRTRTEGGIELDTVRRKRDVVLEIKLSTDSRESYRRRVRGGQSGNGRVQGRELEIGTASEIGGGEVLVLVDGSQGVGSDVGIGAT